MEQIEQMLKTSASIPFIEEKFRRLDGVIVDVEVAVVSYQREGLDYMQIVARDITERKRHERERESIITVSTASGDDTDRYSQPYAFQMLSPIPYLKHALDIPYCHHEKWDGSGYPRGLKGEQIPLSARLFAVVDVFDALTSDRPYRSARRQGEVHRYIREQAGILTRASYKYSSKGNNPNSAIHVS